MEKNENIEFNRILDILKNRIIFIVLILIVFTVLGYWYSYYCVTPEYKSTSTLLLIPNNDNSKSITNSDLTLNSSLISTYSNIAKNSKVLKQVINNLNLDMTEGELLENIQINIVKDTHIMEIAVTNPDAQRAMDITKEISKVFLNEIQEIYNLDNIGIVDEAQLPNQPYNINHIKDIAMFFVIGIVVNIIYIMLVYLFDNTIKKEEDIERYTKIKALGNIPINNTNKKNEIINRDSAKSYITECINTVRTNILYMNSTKNAKTILITSCTPREGKSWISANTAISFAETNKKVLLVDCDMRKGRANKIFDIENGQGLSNYLYAISGNVKNDVNLAKDFIKETKIPNLHILTNGIIPPNPSELLASNSMKELIAILKNLYDIIIIDAPPCKLVSDSIVLSTIVDSTVLVVDSGKTKISDLKQVKKAITVVGGKIIGAILNKRKVTGRTYSKNYYYGHATNKNNYELNSKKIITVKEIIDEAMPKLKAKDFNLFFDEDQSLRSNEELIRKIESSEGNKDEDIKEFINSQNMYLEKVVNTMSDMRSQLNSDIMKNKIEARRQQEEIKNIIPDEIDNIYNEIKDVKTSYKEIIQEIKENNTSNTNELIQQLNEKRLTSEQIQEMLREEVSNSIYTSEIEKIYNEIKETKLNYEQLNSKNLTSEQIQEILREEVSNSIYNSEIEKIYNEIKEAKLNYEQLSQELKKVPDVNEIIEQLNSKNLTTEQIQEILKEEMAGINYTQDIEKIYSEIENTKASYNRTIEEIVDINNKRLIELLSKEEKNKEQIQDLLNDKIEEIQQKNQLLLKEEISNIDYTEQINQMNEMIANLKDSYLELSNIIRTNNTGQKEDEDNTENDNDNDNVINIKQLKQQKEEKQTKRVKSGSFPIDKDIQYSELEKTATYVVKIPNKKSSNFSNNGYESIM